MDNRNRNSNDHLGVNKFGKNIRKSPLHQPNNNFVNTNRQQPQPQVYNINKNDFRNIVQQLTGSPAREPFPRPVNNSPKPQSQRLQKIRPPPLIPITRPSIPIHHPVPVPMGPPVGPPAQYGNNNAFVRTPPQFGQPSPVSQYMRYLQNSIIDTGPAQAQGPLLPQHQFSSAGPGLLPNPPAHLLTSPRMGGPPPLLPSPNSQFLLPSPSGFLNLMSPRSPYPLLSPGILGPGPLSPSFGFPPMSQTGISGPGLQPPVSPGIFFPLSPASFFPVSSPRWNDQKS